MATAGPLMKNSASLKFEVRRYGEPTNPCVISIIGTGASMNAMNVVVEALAARGLYVLNFNPRDTCGSEVFKQCQAAVPAEKNDSLMASLGELFSADGGINSASLEKIRSGEIYVPFNWWDMAEDVAEVIDAEGLTHRKVSIIGFSTAGTISQVIMCHLKDKLNCAVLCCGSYDQIPKDRPFDNPALQELMAEVAAVTPDLSKEERIAKLLPAQKAFYEIADGEEWEDIHKKGLEDDFDKGWIDIYGGMNPFSILAWASWAAVHDQHKANLKENNVPCLVVAGKQDPIVPHQQSIKLAENTGSATLHLHEHGHILGPAAARGATLDTIADFIKTKSRAKSSGYAA